MRITGGKATGIRLQVPCKGPEVRPATDRMREAAFSSIGPSVAGARVLDLFAGTGAYGLESLSRGAKEVTWIESARGTAAILKINRKEVEKSMGQRTHGRLLIRDIRRHGLSSGDRFEFIFADPPYDAAQTLLPDIFCIVTQHLSDSPEAKFLLEVPGNLAIEMNDWEEIRRFGGERSGPSLRVLVRHST